MSHAWRALRHRNFKLFFFGQSISLIGNWMTRLATTWLVYHLTHSALLLGIVGFAGQILTFALAPFAGVWVERLNRRKLLLWTQAAAAVQSLAMAALTLTQRDQHTRANARGLGLRPYVSSNPHDPSALCASQPDGLALRRADAHLCRPGASRRRGYPGLADGSLWGRCACVVMRPIYQEMGLLPASDIDLSTGEREPAS